MKKYLNRLTSQDKADLKEARYIVICICCLALVCLLITLWMASRAISEISLQSKDNAMERSARLYSIIISTQWSQTSKIEETMTFLRETEIGITDVWLVNNLAGVISPLDKAYKVLNDPELDRVLADDTISETLSIVDSRAYATILDDSNLLLGVLIIDFSNEIVGKEISGGMNFFSSLIMCMFFAILTACYLVHTANKRWRKLIIMVENAIEEEGETKFERPPMDAAQSTYGKHQFMYYRLLTKLGSL